MEYRNLGNSGLKVPVLSLGTATFGGTNEFFKRWGQTGVEEAKRLVDICLDKGVNFFDTANVYSHGDAEIVLGAAIKSKRNQAIVATKASFSMGENPNDKGSSRHHIIGACEDSLKRLDTDFIDLYFMHGYDAGTPMEETLQALDHLISSGKVRYIGCSNFAAWQLMKALSISERNRLQKYIVYQGYYSLIGRDSEQELIPLLKDQKMGLMAWSPLGWGRLTGKIVDGKPVSEGRIKSGGAVGGPPVSDDHLKKVLGVLQLIANETERTIPQIAINWLIKKDIISNIVLGARTEQQLIDNLGSVEFSLNEQQMQMLNEVSYQDPIYPHWVGER